MGIGGNAKDRRRFRRAVQREAESRAAQIERVANTPETGATSRPENPALPPWYERGLFWGFLSLAAAIVLTLAAAARRDLRWLLVFVGLLLVPPLWLACRELRWRWARRPFFAVFMCLVGMGLLLLNILLRPRPAPTAQGAIPDVDLDRAKIIIGRPEFLRRSMYIGPRKPTTSNAGQILRLPVGFAGPAEAEVHAANVHNPEALNVKWYGGLFVSERLDTVGEDQLYAKASEIKLPEIRRMQKDGPIALHIQTDHAVSNKELQSVRADLHGVTKKFFYVVIIGDGHDYKGEVVAEKCAHYESTWDMDSLDKEVDCTNHNRPISPQ